MDMQAHPINDQRDQHVQHDQQRPLLNNVEQVLGNVGERNGFFGTRL